MEYTGIKKLHIGCGPIYFDGWINMDISSVHKTDVCGDVLQTHFDDESFDAIYGCHFFEHLKYPVDAVECLNRFYRWLKPGGILRLAVPDLELAVRAYVNSGDLKFLYANDFKAYYNKDTAGERLNFFVKAFEHQHCYDYTTMGWILQDAGFKKVSKKEANESSIPGFSHDRFISESLYVEAIK